VIGKQMDACAGSFITWVCTKTRKKNRAATGTAGGYKENPWGTEGRTRDQERIFGQQNRLADVKKRPLQRKLAALGGEKPHLSIYSRHAR